MTTIKIAAVYVLVFLFSELHSPLDIRYLNHALFFERFICSFYERGLSRYSQEEFVRAGYPDWVRGRYTQIFDTAKVHRDFLESAITSAGSERVRPCNYELCV